MQLLFSLVLAFVVAAPILAGVVWSVVDRTPRTRPKVVYVWEGRRAHRPSGDPPWWAWFLLLAAFAVSFAASLHIL
jgi:phosphate/sulfate permease